MKPFQPRCSSAQIERKWPATKDYFSFGEEAIAFPAGPRARCAWHQVACRGERRPRFSNFPVIPAPGVDQFDRRIDCLNLRSIFGADALNTQDVDPLHGRLPECIVARSRHKAKKADSRCDSSRTSGDCPFIDRVRRSQPGESHATLDDPLLT